MHDKFLLEIAYNTVNGHIYLSGITNSNYKARNKIREISITITNYFKKNVVIINY